MSNVQIWLINSKREFFIELYNSHFLKTRINAFFHMWSLQEGGGAIYCKMFFWCNSTTSFKDRIHPRRLSHFKKNATVLNVHRLNHMLKEKRWADPTIGKKREQCGRGRERERSLSWLLYPNRVSGLSENLTFNTGKSLTHMWQLQFHKSNTNIDFPFALLLKITS